MNPIIVTDTPEKWHFLSHSVEIVSAIDYLTQPPTTGGGKQRIINLCRSYQYQSTGYYVSLIAEARNQKVIPSVTTIQDIKNPSLSTLLFDSIEDQIEDTLKHIKSLEFTLSIYFGQNIADRYCALSQKLHTLLPIPLFRVIFRKNKKWKIQRAFPISIEDVSESHETFLRKTARIYLQKKRFHLYKQKNYFYDLAILYDKDDPKPASDEKAIEQFIKAGEELNFNVHLIEKDDYKSIAEYDALFIRNTTCVNHYTYRFARRAASENLVVMDDPLSIVRCSNKVYLAELLQKNHLPTPETHLVCKKNWQELSQRVSFPCVIKQPDSAFSKGVVKVENAEIFKDTIKEYLQDSELLIVQAFTPSSYDWRIGVLDNKPLFACRYYMAKGHWQIYNWQSPDKEETEGGFETIQIDEVPKKVMKTALQATRLIGNGLYGVDLKTFGEEVYIIEINDNPSIDYQIEDLVAGNNLYLTIMQSFFNRLKKSHGHNI